MSYLALHIVPPALCNNGIQFIIANMVHIHIIQRILWNIMLYNIICPYKHFRQDLWCCWNVVMINQWQNLPHNDFPGMSAAEKLTNLWMFLLPLMKSRWYPVTVYWWDLNVINSVLGEIFEWKHTYVMYESCYLSLYPYLDSNHD